MLHLIHTILHITNHMIIHNHDVQHAFGWYDRTICPLAKNTHIIAPSECQTINRGSCFFGIITRFMIVIESTSVDNNTSVPSLNPNNIRRRFGDRPHAIHKHTNGVSEYDLMTILIDIYTSNMKVCWSCSKC